MLTQFLRHPKALIFSLVIHGLILGLVVLDMVSEPKELPSEDKEDITTIKAKAVNANDLLLQQQAKAKLQQQQAEDKLKQEAKKIAAERKKRQLEEKKKAEQKKADLAKKKAKQEAEKKAEQERQKIAKEKKRKAEELKKAEALKQKKLAEEKRQREAEEAEKKRLEEEARLAKEAEQKKIEAEKKKLAEQKKADELEQQRKERELQAQIAAEEKQRQLNDFKAQYILAIQNKIQRNWRVPIDAGKMPACEVNVLQGPGGLIMDVTFGRCPTKSGYRLSLENAVYKSEPLPEPKDSSLFDREVKLTFRPNN